MSSLAGSSINRGPDTATAASGTQPAANDAHQVGAAAPPRRAAKPPPSFLMSVFLLLWHHAIGCYMLPEDPFHMKARKITVFLICATNMLQIVVPYWMYRAVTLRNEALATTSHSAQAVFLQRSTVMWLDAAGLMAFGAIGAFQYLYLRINKTCSDLFMTVTLSLIICVNVVFTVTMPFYPVEPIMVATGIALFLCKPWKVWIPCFMILNLLTVRVINDCFGNILMVPGYQDETWRTWPDTLLIRSAGIICMGMALLSVAAQVWQIEQSAKKAERAADLSHRVASHIANYDTDGCRAEVEAYEVQEDDDADAELVATTLLIVANLERYRPHLPNYLLRGASDEEDVSDEEGEKAPHGDKRHSSGAAAARPAAGAPQRSARSQRSSGGGKGDDTSGATSDVTLREHGAALSVISQSWLRTTVACCSLYFDWSPLSQHATSPLSAARAQHDIVAALGALSTATHAALHSFVGDALVASWNAARRTAAPETKACRFALRAREAIRTTATAFHIGSLMNVGGTITTGPAYSLTAGDDRLRMFTLILDRNAVARMAPMRQTSEGIGHRIIADARTRDTARFHIALTPVDVVLSPPSTAPDGGNDATPAPPRWAPLFEVTKEKDATTAQGGPASASGVTGDSEWMYELEKESEHERAMEECLKAIHQCGGSHAQAVELLTTFHQRFTTDDNSAAIASQATIDWLNRKSNDRATT